MTETGAEKNITDMDTKQGQKHARQANNLIGGDCESISVN